MGAWICCLGGGLGFFPQGKIKERAPGVLNLEKKQLNQWSTGRVLGELGCLQECSPMESLGLLGCAGGKMGEKTNVLVLGFIQNRPWMELQWLWI